MNHPNSNLFPIYSHIILILTTIILTLCSILVENLAHEFHILIFEIAIVGRRLKVRDKLGVDMLFAFDGVHDHYLTRRCSLFIPIILRLNGPIMSE